MRYLPCERCQHDADTCEVRQRVSEGVREFNRIGGQRLTSAKFTCERRLEGFQLGARVIVTECCWEEAQGHYSSHLTRECEDVEGTVLEHRGHRVSIWLDRETGLGNRLVTIYPTPVREDGAIGVVPAGDSVSWEDAYAEMIRETRKRRGDPGDDHCYCPDCEQYFAALQWSSTGAVPFSVHEEKCPECGSKNAGSTDDFAEKGLLPEQQGKT